jgi:hypothetical protein
MLFCLGSFLEGSAQEINTLTLNSFTIEVNGEAVKTDTTITAKLVTEVPTEITIYDKDNLKYVAVFTYKRSKNRLKLMRKFYAVKGMDKPVSSKTKKDVQYIKVSIPKTFNGKSSENLIVDKEKLESIFVSFKYEFKYQ